MQVVLIKRVPKLGYEHDVVNVKPGFARNFLFPNQLAIPAKEHDVNQANAKKAKMVQKLEAIVANAKEIAEKLKDAVLKFTRKTRGEKLYGSLTESDIAEAVLEQCKVEISKNMVVMKEHIKTAGEHDIKLQLAEGVDVKIKVVIEKE